MIHLMEIHSERNRKHRLPKASHEQNLARYGYGQIRIANAIHCSLAAAARHERGSPQNISFEP